MPADVETPVPLRRPLKPASDAGQVTIVDPPQPALTLTPDAAEISGLRLIAEADEARRKADPPR